jgi:sigma-B regulation protein RsbU (phosphoserine phosphatase)
MTHADGPLRAAGATRHGADYKALYRKLERTIDRIEKIDDTWMALSSCLKSLVDHFHEDLGFVGGRIYEREGGAYILRRRYGGSKRAPIGYRIPITYEPIRTLLRDGFIIRRRTDPDFDERIEGAIGVSKFAAFCVGDDMRHILSLTIKGPIDEEHTLYALNGVRHIINMKLRAQHLHDIIQEARDIQLSILPKEPPRFTGYNIHGESRPADIVGGDLFDYLPQTNRLMGVAVADASGHGLPAALQARDIITGMRMGMQGDLKIIAAIERLNRVINMSGLTSRFVSLFYCEIETNGNFIYCNAGHPPPLLLQGSTFRELTEGGLILGPNPTAQYQRGFATMSPGDCVLMYTDGVTEGLSPSEKEYGVGRLKSALRRSATRPAREVVEAIFADLASFTRGRAQQDDRTVLVIKKT